MQKLLEQRNWQYSALLFFALIWSAVFILTKKGLEVFTPIEAASIRIIAASISVLPYSIRFLRGAHRRLWPWIACCAVIGNFLPIFLVNYAQTGMGSAMTGVLNSLMPFFAFTVGALFFKSETKLSNFAGLLIGSGGTVGLILYGKNSFYTESFWPVALMLGSVLLHGFNINIIKIKLVAIPAAEIVGGIFLFAGPFAAVSLSATDIGHKTISAQFWEALVYMIIVGVGATNIALIGFNHLLKHTSAIFAASVTYIIPVFAIFWGVIDGESFSVYQLLFSAIILLGVYMVNKPA